MINQQLYKFLSLGILLGSFAVGWLWMDFRGFMENRLNLQNEQRLVIETGTTYSSLSKKLYNEGISRSHFYLQLAGKIYPELTKIKRGEYLLTNDMTPESFFKTVSEGKVIQYQITLIEGWSFKQILEELADHEKLKPTSLESKLEFIKTLGIEEDNPEGWFFPETYNYSLGDTDLHILSQSYLSMQSKLQELWNDRDIGLPYASPYEALIMASIIEKETGKHGERDRIAGVFVRRLLNNMKLQTDPTVIYGIGDSYDGNIRKRDLRTYTPYNTYKIKGLPPTPIASPSEASIYAALHPREGTEMYFVSRGDGSHEFSTTLEEHNKAVRKYQL